MTLTLVTSVAGGSLAIAIGQLTAASAGLTAQVPAGYAVLRSWQEAAPVPANVRDRFEELVGGAKPIVTWGVELGDTPRGFQGQPRLFNSVADVERWIGNPLTAEQSEALDGGAIGLPRQPDGQVAINPSKGEWVELNAIEIAMPVELAANYGGVVLEPATRTLGLAKVSQELTYVGLSPDQETLLPEAATRAGIDPAYIVYYRAPKAYTLPDSFVWALSSLAAVSGVLMFGLTTSQAKALRPQLAALDAIGIPRIWVTKVLSTQVWLISFTCGVLSLMAVLVGNLLVWFATPEALVPLADPVSLAVVGVVTLIGSLAALPAGLLALRPAERAVS